MKKHNLKKIDFKKITITNMQKPERNELKGGITFPKCISGEQTGCDGWCGTVQPCMV